MVDVADNNDKIVAIDVMSTNKVAVARGSKLEFRKGPEVTPAYTLKFKDDTPITPKKLMFQDGNRRILMLTPKKDVLVRVDTETGSNLGEIGIKIHEDLSQPIDTIVPQCKFGQLKAQDNVQLVGLSGNRVFNLDWDTRMKDPNLLINPEYCYTKGGKKSLFTSIATTSSGQMVVGDTQGVVRLFQSPLNDKCIKRSKTNLNQLSDPVRAVDVSSDGQWIVWTTKEYLAVVNTHFQDKVSGETKSGFQRSMGNERPDALILRISEDDMVKYGIKEVDLKAARFDNSPYLQDGSNQEISPIIEEEIVASTGQFMLRWRLRPIKLEYFKHRTTDNYRIRPNIYDQQSVVIDKCFQYGRKTIVTAMEDELTELHLDASEGED